MVFLKNNNPIGIFDSGIGGLTIARAIKRKLPNESLIYFGDTQHLPYGDKSSKSIVFFSNSFWISETKKPLSKILVKSLFNKISPLVLIFFMIKFSDIHFSILKWTSLILFSSELNLSFLMM